MHHDYKMVLGDAIETLKTRRLDTEVAASIGNLFFIDCYADLTNSTLIRRH